MCLFKLFLEVQTWPTEVFVVDTVTENDLSLGLREDLTSAVSDVKILTADVCQGFVNL